MCRGGATQLGGGLPLAEQERVEWARAVVDELAEGTAPAYGISTGVGALAARHIPADQRARLQRSPGGPQGRLLTTDRPSPWRAGATVRVGSREHYGWPETDYLVVGTHSGEESDAEFLQVTRLGEEPRTLFLRRRFGALDWTAAGEEEVPVGAWYGDALTDGEPFQRDRRNPEAWLYTVPTTQDLGPRAPGPPRC